MMKLLESSNIIIVLGVFLFTLVILSKASDLLVDNAVNLSKILGLSEVMIGATIVSLGTTLPELSASVVSALQGNGNFAIGNAVGSIITNTSLIIGIGALYGKIPVDRQSSQKLNLLIVAVFLLIIPTIPLKIAESSGRIPQWMGIVFLVLIPMYICFLIYQEKRLGNKSKEKKSKDKKSKESIQEKSTVEENTANGNSFVFIVKIMLAAFLIAISASGLVGSAEILATRAGIPDVVIASTLVAFGTSVPELSTCIAAAKKRHGGLAVGNIMGANILNILMVVGASVALTTGGIAVSNEFYTIHFIALGVVVAAFGYFAYNKKIDEISTKEGSLLILIYIIYLGANLFRAL